MMRTFLAMSGAEYDVGIAAERVREVVAAADWGGASPLEVATLVPALADGGAAPRVLSIVLAGGALLPLRVTSPIVVRTIEAGALMRLPRVVTRGARWLRAVVFADDAPPLVVIDPEAMADRAAADDAAAEHDSLQELW